ncbi:hypothetical protein ALQ42_200000 [Pseudomonas savastanoi pv. glycinea]|uniref:Uncharacterized protein n=1 Tax=Pseudomonas savastanoi pv. glycinea TaxID=318 RepID=A0A3M3U5I7_PSESG|nr:hypothetical protein ALQ42_200000 [Pseudomonas savastanoi pv. glycinea]RMO37750.1 hypothetical protein ALQ41_200156 [Pseudomonas savastanoi pv. glycinea]
MEGQTPGHHTKDFDLLEALDRRVLGVVGAQHPATIELSIQTFDHGLIVDVGDDQIPNLRRPCSVDDELRPIQNARRLHAVPLGFTEPNVRSSEVYQVVQGDRGFVVIGRWAGKAARGAA